MYVHFAYNILFLFQYTRACIDINGNKDVMSRSTWAKKSKGRFTNNVWL